MKIELKKIASIQIGYSFRERLDSVSAGAVAVIQMKDLVNDQVNCSELVRIDEMVPKEHHLVRTGDIVFRSRGVTNTCAILLDEPGAAVVAAPLFRIRVTDSQVLPRYLSWYINQPSAQAHIASHTKGTAQKMISKDVLDSLEIVVPSLEQQERILELAAMADQEQNLMKELAEKRKRYISAKLIEMARGESKR